MAEVHAGTVLYIYSGIAHTSPQIELLPYCTLARNIQEITQKHAKITRYRNNESIHKRVHENHLKLSQFVSE
jgi:hypothetical protein